MTKTGGTLCLIIDKKEKRILPMHLDTVSGSLPFHVFLCGSCSHQNEHERQSNGSVGLRGPDAPRSIRMKGAGGLDS